MQHDLIAKNLFCKYYNINKSEITINDVMEVRYKRFKYNKYWSIWKERGVYFAFFEAFFHKIDGNNQLHKIPDNEKYLFQHPDDILNNFKNSQDLAAYLSSNNIKRMVNQHSKNIIEACEMLKNNLNYQIPRTVEDLLQFKGYGRKISNMFLNLALDIPRIAVDVRVFRASMELGIIDKKYKGMEKNEKIKLYVENELHDIFKDSIYLVEMDYLLFQYGGKINH